MSSGIHIVDRSLYLERSYLIKKLGLTKDKVNSWRRADRKGKEWLLIAGTACVSYESIPAKSKKDLPSEASLIKEHSQINIVSKLLEKLKASQTFGYTQYSHFYQKESTLSSEQVTKFSRLHAVFQSIIELRENEGFKDLENLYQVFNMLYPDKYTSKHALSNAIRRAGANGVMSVALDKRVFGNNNEETNRGQNPVTKYWIAQLVSHPRKFTNPKILKLIEKACNEKGLKSPSLSWVKQKRLSILRNIEAYNSRYGQQETNKKMPFASLKHPEYANNVWQMDGWTLPFWSKGEKYVQKYTLVRLIDSNSKKIVGYSVGKSEDTALITEAIRDAVNSTGVLPFEVLTDNHAFNKTKEAQNLIKLFSKKGATWEVTQNPQYKAIVERYNQHLDALCKNYYGYLGQGIRSKSVDALAKPEMIDQYYKNPLSPEEIKAIAVQVVEAYNITPNKSGKTPADLYAANANPYPIQVSVFDRAELLTMQTEKQIRRGQITFQKGIEKFEFQLPSALFQMYNDCIVVVKYEDFRDGIYLFDKPTGEPITYLGLKGKINSAKVDQTPEDIEALNRIKGRISGIKARARKELEDITERALKVCPDAYAIMNRLTTPKDVLQELEESSTLQRITEDKGVPMNTIQIPKRHFDNGTTALQPVENKRKSPFAATDNKIEMYDPTKDIDND